ncbi:MAG: NAD-dependent epimerase/dehydratase family protein [Caldimonas sp.]
MTTAKPVVLVTGASGFVGSHVVEALVDRYDVVALDHTAPAQPPERAEFVALDVTSEASVDAALARVRVAHGDTIASVIHLAAFIDLTNEDDPRYESITVRGTERLVRALESLKVEQFVFMSTLLVHGPSGHGHRIDEDAPFDDRFPYRASKIRTERLLRERHGSMPIVVLRAAGVYDEECHAAFLDQQIARIYEKRLTSHFYPGDLSAGQPYLHLADLIDAMLRAIDRRAVLPAESIFLLGEADVMGYGEIQQAIGQGLHGEPWPTVPIPASIASTGAWMQDKVFDEDPFIRPWMVEISSDHYEIDTTRARSLLDWEPRRSLRATLPHMLDRLKADPVGWYRSNHLESAAVAADGVSAALARPEAVAAGESAGGADSPAAPMDMRAMHFDLLWVHWLNILLGAWLISSPFAFGGFDATGFSATVQQVTLDRHLADPVLRSLWLARSDVVSGLLVMAFGALSLSPRFAWAQWANAAVGTWLLFAPLLFWAPSAATYANDTFVGTLVIAFAVLVPMMPGMSMDGMMDASDLPPGWTYSPSTYLQRLPIIALGAFGFFIARTLTAYQLGHIDAVWEPFFGGAHGLNGTETIITSDVSKAWPIPDAGLGGMAYMFEVLMGVMGDRRRWRTMPWMVAMFGIVVVPLGAVSIFFIVIQPVVIGTWCTLCLVTAVAMLAMIPYSLDELVAMGQFLVQSHDRGEPFWRTFFRGGAQPKGGRDAAAGFDAPLPTAIRSAVRGVTLPWTLVGCCLVGAALMFTRVLFGTAPPLADSDHVSGALIVTFAVMAMAEVARPLRFVNVAFALWLIVAPWWLEGATPAAAWTEAAAGLCVLLLSLPRGRRSEAHYGRWDRFVV